MLNLFLTLAKSIAVWSVYKSQIENQFAERALILDLQIESCKKVISVKNIQVIIYIISKNNFKTINIVKLLLEKYMNLTYEFVKIKKFKYAILISQLIPSNVFEFSLKNYPHSKLFEMIKNYFYSMSPEI